MGPSFEWSTVCSELVRETALLRYDATLSSLHLRMCMACVTNLHHTSPNESVYNECLRTRSEASRTSRAAFLGNPLIDCEPGVRSSPRAMESSGLRREVERDEPLVAFVRKIIDVFISQER